MKQHSMKKKKNSFLVKQRLLLIYLLSLHMPDYKNTAVSGGMSERNEVSLYTS